MTAPRDIAYQPMLVAFCYQRPLYFDRIPHGLVAHVTIGMLGIADGRPL